MLGEDETKKMYIKDGIGYFKIGTSFNLGEVIAIYEEYDKKQIKQKKAKEEQERTKEKERNKKQFRENIRKSKLEILAISALVINTLFGTFYAINYTPTYADIQSRVGSIPITSKGIITEGPYKGKNITSALYEKTKTYFH